MQTPHSTTKPDGLLSAPAVQPAATGFGPRADRSEGQPETGSLFEDELRRAAGDDGTADAKRTQREASDARRSAQAGKAEHNQAQREERRTERAGAQETRAERRSEQSSAAEVRAASRPPAPSEPVVPPSIRPEASPAPPEAQTARRRATAAQPEPAAHGESAARRARLQSNTPQAALAQPPQASTPSANAAQPTTPTQTAPRAAAPAPGQQGQAGQQGQQDLGAAAAERNARASSTQPARPETAFRDLVSELMVTREAELDRQASVLRQVRAHLAPGGREISIALSPASLGQIQMRLALRSGRLTAVMRATRPETLEALQNQLPELTSTLEAQGFEVQDFDLALA